MNNKEALEYIHSHKRFDGEPTLARMRGLMKRLGDPQNTLQFMHIAGTNGKGSTTAMAASVLQRAGYKTGRYVSPFVLCFRERMQVDGEMILEHELAELADEVRRCEAEMTAPDRKENSTGHLQCPPTEFEVVTAIAFLWFARRECDIVCLEVGLGGRFDATNVIAPPLVQVVTSISLDHTEILGDAVEQIAFEKCGIIKGGVTVCSPGQQVEALAVVMECCAEQGSTLVQPNESALEPLDMGVFTLRFRYGGLELSPSLAGAYQMQNAVTAAEACRQLRAGGFAVSDDDIAYGIAHTAFPARLEPLCRAPLVLLDGAHNPSGAAALEQVLMALRSEGWGAITVLMGMLADKDWQSAAERIARCADGFIAVTPENPRALSGERLAQHAGQFCARCEWHEPPEQAAVEAFASLREGGVLVVCGSLYLAAQLRPVLLKAIGGGFYPPNVTQ